MQETPKVTVDGVALDVLPSEALTPIEGVVLIQNGQPNFYIIAIGNETHFRIQGVISTKKFILIVLALTGLGGLITRLG